MRQRSKVMLFVEVNINPVVTTLSTEPWEPGSKAIFPALPVMVLACNPGFSAKKDPKLIITNLLLIVASPYAWVEGSKWMVSPAAAPATAALSVVKFALVPATLLTRQIVAWALKAIKKTEKSKVHFRFIVWILSDDNIRKTIN